MKHVPWLLLALLLLCRTTRAEEAGDLHADPPKNGALWRHPATGLSLPQEIAGLRMEGTVIYKGLSFGQSVRYIHRKLGARVDVYVYPCRGASETPKEREALAREEISQVMAGLEYMEKQGNYRKVSWGSGNLREITLGDDSKTTAVSAPASYELKDQGSDPPTFTPLTSLAVIIIYEDHYVKLRYTLPADPGKEALAMRDDFVKRLHRCVLDASLRPTILKSVATYRKDPLSEAAREAAGTIIAFSKDSPLVTIVIGKGLVEFAQKCEAQVKGAQVDVMRAFVTGAADASLHDQGPAKVVDAAIAEVKALCGKLKIQHPEFEPPSLNDFESAILEDNKNLLKEAK